jgi:voltage-gated potassium channel
VIPRRYLVMILTPIVLVIVGTLGYWILEKPYSLFDSLYMTVITLTTVGYAEVHELSTRGRVFTIFLLFGGVFTLFYTAAEILRVVVSGELHDLFGKRYLARSLATMKNHLIVCGFGRMGKLVCLEFSSQKLPFVIIDRRAEALHGFNIPHGVSLVGDATSDEILKQAGVDRARALVTVAASDADNLYITMSARLLNESLFIVARAEQEPAEQKLQRAGANRVISPYAIGGFRVAQAVLRPTVLDFIELATRTEHLEIQIEETQVEDGSALAGVTLRDSRLRQDLGVIIVAIKKLNGPMIYNPAGEYVLAAADILIALGHRENLDRMDGLARSARRGT